jgi:hypothetical protein
MCVHTWYIPLSGRSECRAHQCIQCCFLIRVRHNSRVIFRPQIRLHSLAVLRPTVKDIFTRFVASHKGNSADRGGVTDEVDGVVTAVNHLRRRSDDNVYIDIVTLIIYVLRCNDGDRHHGSMLT